MRHVQMTYFFMGATIVLCIAHWHHNSDPPTVTRRHRRCIIALYRADSNAAGSVRLPGLVTRSSIVLLASTETLRCIAT